MSEGPCACDPYVCRWDCVACAVCCRVDKSADSVMMMIMGALLLSACQAGG